MTRETKNSEKADKTPMQRHALLVATGMRTFAETCRMRDGETLTEEKIETYIQMLSDIPLAELEPALVMAARECTWFPTVAEIRGFITKHVSAVDQFEAEKGWDAVQKCIRDHGADLWPIFHNGTITHPPVFDGAIGHALRQVGGYQRVAHLEQKEFDFVRRDFLKAFLRYKETGGYLAPSRAEAASMLEQIQRKELPE